MLLIHSHRGEGPDLEALLTRIEQEIQALRHGKFVLLVLLFDRGVGERPFVMGQMAPQLSHRLFIGRSIRVGRVHIPTSLGSPQFSGRFSRNAASPARAEALAAAARNST